MFLIPPREVSSGVVNARFGVGRSAGRSSTETHPQESEILDPPEALLETAHQGERLRDVDQVSLGADVDGVSRDGSLFCYEGAEAFAWDGWVCRRPVATRGRISRRPVATRASFAEGFVREGGVGAQCSLGRRCERHFGRLCERERGGCQLRRRRPARQHLVEFVDSKEPIGI